jgi:glycerol-3-phosphate cytidylyltransferase-like family protein
MSNSISPYGYAKDGKVYLNGYLNFPTREIGVVKESEEASIQYFTKRFEELAKSKVEELAKSVQTSSNKGSFLMKLIHMREYLSKFDGLGDFPSLFSILDSLEQDINVYVEKNRAKNLEIKRALLQEIESYEDNRNWVVVSNKFKEIKLKWIKTGSAYKDEEKELNEKFDAILDNYYQQRNKAYEERNKAIQKRLEKYNQLLDKVRSINQNPTENAIQTVKRLQNEWRIVGKVPKRELMNIYPAFKAEVGKFFAKQKQQSFRNPADRKRDICDKVEKMLDMVEPPIDDVKNLQKEWQRLGKTKHPNDKDFNTRFKIACNELFETHFLNKQARYKYEAFDEKTFFEQLKIKIRLIKESIKKDETELSLMNEKSKRNPQQQHSPNNQGMGGNQQNFDIERLNQINKLKTKQRILKKLQDQLLANY